MSENKELTVIYEINGDEIKLTPSIVQNFLVGSNSKITLPDFKMFTELCKERKLNPFLKEAYCVKYGDQPAQLIVSKDIFLKRAILHPDYDGMSSGVIVQVIETGEIIKREGMFWIASEETVVGAWATVYRKSWTHPRYISVSYGEVCQKTKDGKPNANWRDKPATMSEKVAKVRALREAFAEDLGGLYSSDEIGTDDVSDIIIPDNEEVTFLNSEDVSEVDEQITLEDL